MPLNNTGQILRFWLRQNDGVSEGKAVPLSMTRDFHCEATSRNRDGVPGDPIHLRGCKDDPQRADSLVWDAGMQGERICEDGSRVLKAGR